MATTCPTKRRCRSSPACQRALDEQWTDAAFAVRGIETAEQWWDALTSEPAFAPLLTQRAERFAGKTRQESPPGFDVHV